MKYIMQTSTQLLAEKLKKNRPVVIVSHDEMNKYLDTVVICP
jgi:mRNA interferase MazF